MRQPDGRHATHAHARPRASRRSPSTASSAQPARGWVGWVTTTDHKRIGILYLATAFGFMMLGGVEALLMRTQLARPTTRC